LVVSTSVALISIPRTPTLKVTSVSNADHQLGGFTIHEHGLLSQIARQQQSHESPAALTPKGASTVR
jgi:hypothetical protein